MKAWKKNCTDDKYDKRLYYSLVFAKANNVDKLFKVMWFWHYKDCSYINTIEKNTKKNYKSFKK